MVNGGELSAGVVCILCWYPYQLDFTCSQTSLTKAQLHTLCHRIASAASGLKLDIGDVVLARCDQGGRLLELDCGQSLCIANKEDRFVTHHSKYGAVLPDCPPRFPPTVHPRAHSVRIVSGGAQTEFRDPSASQKVGGQVTVVIFHH